MDQSAFVTIRNVSKRFGDVVAVEDVSLSVAEGHTLALLGPSGCGKTTVLRCLAGLETPEEGHITIARKVVVVPGTACRRSRVSRSRPTSAWVALQERLVAAFC